MPFKVFFSSILLGVTLMVAPVETHPLVEAPFKTRLPDVKTNPRDRPKVGLLYGCVSIYCVFCN